VRELSPEEEDLLAEGKNFEHHGGSVKAGKLEILFRCMQKVDLGRLQLQIDNPLLKDKVCCLPVSSFFLIYYLFQAIPNTLLRAFCCDRSPDLATVMTSDSNFSRYLYIIQVMHDNPALVELMREDNIKNGMHTNWNIDKVICLFFCFISCSYSCQTNSAEFRTANPQVQLDAYKGIMDGSLKSGGMHFCS